MKTLNSNYTAKTLNTFLGNDAFYRERFSDPNRTGLIFRVGKNNLTANFRFKMNGKDHVMKIGSYPSTSLSDIYSTWSDYRLKLDKGINPVKEIEAEKREAKVKQKNTLNVVFQDFYDKYVVLNRKNPEPAMNLYDYHVRKVLGDLPFDEITLIECRDLIDSIKGKRSPQTVYSLLKQCWIHQHGRGFLEPTATNPFLILKAPQVKSTVRDRLITDEELRILWIGLGQANKKVELGVKLLTHTACRSKEINENTWENINFQEETMFIPKELDKEGQDRIKPLSQQSLALFDELRFITGNQEKLIGFDRNVLGRNVIKISKQNNLLDKQGRHFHAHDLRSYFSTNCRKLRLDHKVIESCLSHVTEKGASANYSFYDYQDEKKELFQTWSNHVDMVVS